MTAPGGVHQAAAADVQTHRATALATGWIRADGRIRQRLLAEGAFEGLAFLSDHAGELIVEVLAATLCLALEAIRSSFEVELVAVEFNSPTLQFALQGGHGPLLPLQLVLLLLQVLLLSSSNLVPTRSPLRDL